MDREGPGGGGGGAQRLQGNYTYENKGPSTGQHLLAGDVTATNFLPTFFQNMIQKVPTQGTAMGSGMTWLKEKDKSPHLFSGNRTRQNSRIMSSKKAGKGFLKN